MSLAGGPGRRRLEEALALYRRRFGAPAPFWLRDDDAVAPGAALDRLLSIAETAGLPVALAVIPARLDPALRPHLDARPSVSVLQHGASHANHAPASQKKCEFGPERDLRAMEAEIAEGRERLAGFAGVLPIFVPPWNRIAPELVAVLPTLGFCALSTYGDRAAPEAAPGLLAFNTQIDPVDWRGGGGFSGAETVLAALAARLERLARGEADAGEPTGILTHHLVHDAIGFAFLADLLEFLAESEDAEWICASILIERFGTGSRAMTA